MGGLNGIGVGVGAELEEQEVEQIRVELAWDSLVTEGTSFRRRVREARGGF